MIASDYILDDKLPLVLDFKALKEEGLAFIQEHSGYEWTNLNPSDPGITILDQLCYAFTELGFCVDFPMQDILTDAKGEMHVQNQFYLPEHILTTSPVTGQDYIKYIVNGIPEVGNAIIRPIDGGSMAINGLYQVYVKVSSVAMETQKSQGICRSVFLLLNDARNLGEFFLWPRILTPKTYDVYGSLVIEEGFDSNVVLAGIKNAINNYIFPDLEQTGYDELLEAGMSSDQIFNGPLLQRGWIPKAGKQQKKDVVRAFEIKEVIGQVPGVSSATDIYFRRKKKKRKKGKEKYTITAGENELLVLDPLPLDPTNGFLQPKGATASHEMVRTNMVQGISKINQAHGQLNKVEAMKLAPAPPKGKYRDITSYYSIQNTFPEVYAVGTGSVRADASEFEVARSRQLKGYLTLFDQVLANQFAQLANIGSLFSFKNPMTGTPADLQKFYDSKNPFERQNIEDTPDLREWYDSEANAYKLDNLEYPVPYLYFVPTYFYQSLADTVPNIKPLLKNNNTFGFGYLLETTKEQQERAWKKYRNDPYNSYMWGLMSFIEEEETNLERRNNMLDHLLARQGESPVVLNAIISESNLTGELIKDRIVIKSLLLQNMAIVSYNRTRAYNFLGASFLKSRRKRKNEEDKLHFPPVTEKIRQQFLQGNQGDFIFNSPGIDKEYRVSGLDMINYSCLELKLNLLFALNQYYKNYLSVNNNPHALWMIMKRKGLLLIEMGLLLQSAYLEVRIVERSEPFKVFRSTKKMGYEEIGKLKKVLEKGNPETTSEVLGMVETDLHDWPENEFCLTSNERYLWAIRVSWGKEVSISIDDPILDNTALLIFPKFIFETTTNKLKGDNALQEFRKRLHCFLESELSLQLKARPFFVDEKDLEDLIKAYIPWHDNLIFNPDRNKKTKELFVPDLKKSARNLLKRVSKLKTDNND